MDENRHQDGRCVDQVGKVDFNEDDEVANLKHLFSNISKPALRQSEDFPKKQIS